LASREAVVEPLGHGLVPAPASVGFYWRETQSTLGSPEPPKVRYVVADGDSLEPRINVLVGGYARVELSARLLGEDGSVLYAQADFDVFAREGSSSPESTDIPPSWPFFELTSDQPLYWPQTGQTFFIALHNFDLPPAPMEVWEDGFDAPVAVLAPEPGGRYAYVPPNDPGLDKLGATATKRLIFVHPTVGGGTASLSFYVHRSRAAKRNQAVGLWVFGASLAGSALIMAVGRERLKPCP
jgi:hypothetical protein